MNSGPIVAMVWEGLDAVKTGRSAYYASLAIDAHI
jgi:nucleoside diphosphate kinase